MSASLFVLCLAAFAIVAVSVSVVVGATLPWLDRLVVSLSPRHRARFWLLVAALPAAVGVLAVGASFFPAMGIGRDHCLTHGPHHPHLCPHHLGAAPGIVLVFIALLSSVRVFHVLTALGRSLRLSRRTSGTLAQVSDEHAGAWVIPADEPHAFVLGTLRPRVHVSRGLLALGPDVVEAVLAHERVHAARRDLLWRALCPVMALGFLPRARRALCARLCAAQEMAADAEAAATLSDGRFKLAEALLRLARVTKASTPGIAFVQGDLEVRVRALLEARKPGAAWRARTVVLCASLVPAVAGALHESIHHALETLLGALS